MRAVVTFLTNVADGAVLLPIAFVVAVLFALIGWRRGLIAWTAAIGATLGLTFALKLAFLVCGELGPGGAVRSPSGHAAASAAIYGGLLAIVVGHLSGRSRWALPCATLIAVVIGASRVILGVHTVPEVLLGGGVGILGALAVARLAGPPPATLPIRRVGALVVLIVVLFHGLLMPAEAAIRQIAADVWPFSSCR